MAEHNVKQLAKNTGFLYLRMIVVMVITLFTSRIILQTLGFEDFGIYNVVGSIVVFLSFFRRLCAMQHLGILHMTLVQAIVRLFTRHFLCLSILT